MLSGDEESGTWEEFELQVPLNATISRSGLVELATTVEVDHLSDDERAITPASLEETVNTLNQLAGSHSETTEVYLQRESYLDYTTIVGTPRFIDFHELEYLIVTNNGISTSLNNEVTTTKNVDGGATHDGTYTWLVVDDNIETNLYASPDATPLFERQWRVSGAAHSAGIAVDSSLIGIGVTATTLWHLRELGVVNASFNAFPIDQTDGSLGTPQEINFTRAEIQTALGANINVLARIVNRGLDSRGAEDIAVYGNTLYILFNNMISFLNNVTVNISVILPFTITGSQGSFTLEAQPIRITHHIHKPRSITYRSANALVLLNNNWLYYFKEETAANRIPLPDPAVDNQYLSTSSGEYVLGDIAVAISDEDPLDVGQANAPGSEDEVGHYDHAHRLPIQNTLEWDSANALGVSIHDVIQHLSEYVQYFTSTTDYSNNSEGSAVGQTYNTSRYPKNIQRVRVSLEPADSLDDAIYRVGVYHIEPNNEIISVLGQSADTPPISSQVNYDFDLAVSGSDELGIPLTGNERIAILLRRIGAGDQQATGIRHGAVADNSPHQSYPDAQLDFVLDQNVNYRHENPAAGNTTHSHGDNIRGNIRIFYTVTIDHGSLVGDGNITAGDIDTGGAFDGFVLTASTGRTPLWEQPPGFGSGTVVVANPPGDDGEDLTRVSFDTVRYNIPGGGSGGGTTGVIIQDNDVEEGTEIETLNFGANIAVNIAGTTATMTAVGGTGTLSDNAPEFITPVTDSGDDTEVSRSDHGHRLKLQNTLEFDNSNNLGVAIGEVTELLAERISYYTNDNTYTGSNEGSAIGESYTTSSYPKNLARVRVSLNPPDNVDDAIYRMGVYSVEDNDEIIAVLGQSAESTPLSVTGLYTFDLAVAGAEDFGVPIPANQRIAILLRRVGAGDQATVGIRYGDEAANSPQASYPDAELDFVRVHHVIFRHENPATGDTRHANNSSIRGNFQLHYKVNIDHGSLIGDGNVNANHITSGSAVDGQVLTADGSTNASWETISVVDTQIDSGIAADGHVLTADGSGNSTWEAEGALQLGNGDPEDIGTTAAGTSDEAARADHGHGGVDLTVAETLPDYINMPIASTPAVSLSSLHINSLVLNASAVRVNRGGFVIADGTNSRYGIEVPIDGNYTIEINLAATHSTGTTPRGMIYGEIIVIRAGAVIDSLTGLTTAYFRTSDSADDLFIDITHTIDLEADDRVEFRTFAAIDTGTTYVYGAIGSEIKILRNVGTPNVNGVGGSNERKRLRHVPIVTSPPMVLTRTQLTTDFTTGTHDFQPITFEEINPDEVEEINLIIRLNTVSEIAYKISRNDFLRIGFEPATEWSNWFSDNDNIVNAFHIVGTGGATSFREGSMLLEYGRISSHRSSSRTQILVFFVENANSMMEQINIYVSSSTEVLLTRADIVIQEDIP